VLQAILECKAFPAGMELFPSANDEQFEFIKREIDSSDYYLVVIAGRYGSRTADEVSFTEKEFDYALAQGKPILAFLIENPSKLTFDKCEGDAEDRVKLSQFREKASKSRLVKHYNNPDELKAQVLQSLYYQFQVNPKQGWVPAGQSKREDLEEIRNLLTKVLSLESENNELRSLNKDATACLGQGEDSVSWVIDLTELGASVPSWFGLSEAETQFPFETMEFNTTWDEILPALYPGGSSRLDSGDVEPRLLSLFTSKISDLALQEIWRAISARNILTPGLNLGCFWKAKRDIHRQLSGLGLVEEIVETRYMGPSFNHAAVAFSYTNIASESPIKSGTNPVQIVVWKLTRRGEEQLAFISGFRRNMSS
jgi:hypothetical protein